MADRLLTIGHISGAFGVQGWVKLQSATEPDTSILDYQPWYIKNAAGLRSYTLLTGKRHSKGLVAKLTGCNDRDHALSLTGCTINIYRHQLSTLSDGEFYWTDLEGLQVQTLNNTVLGTVNHLFNTGANDVLVVIGERERLIPFIWEQVVKTVDLAKRRLVVDWDPEF
ncbi:ribosome maturation factor RimM [Achromatium sp. WMS2]|nr:ribosome maturation factor RimM [Achromatium sp. WMS2]